MKVKINSLQNILGHGVHIHPESQGKTFCPVCGEKVVEEVIVEEHACIYCRHLVLENDVFCGTCGKQLSGIVHTEFWNKHVAMTADEFNAKKSKLKKEK